MTLTPEEQAKRREGVGSSDSAAAIGLNPYQSQVELWQEKRGLVPPFAGNAPTKWGQLLEHVVRQEYSEVTGRTVLLPGLIMHPTVPIAFCTPDGVTEDDRLYEGKTARFADGWGEPGTDEIPQHYLVQVQHSLAVTLLPVADVAVLIGGQDFRLYEVPADREFQESILTAEAEFWQYVVNGVQPPIDYEAPGVLELLKKLYPGTNGQTVQADEILHSWRAVFEDAKEKEERYKLTAEVAKAHLLEFMGEAALLEFNDGRCLRRKAISKKAYAVEATTYIDTRFIKAKD